MMELLNKKGMVYFDGGFGTMLIAAGKMPNKHPETVNVEDPEIVESIHRMYVEAGSEIVCSNTFSACADRVEGSGYSVEEIITAAIDCAKKAAAGSAKVALDIGPIGELMEPYGDLTEEHAYELFKQEVTAGEKAGADLIAIETMTAIEEVEQALKAAKENTSLPVFVTMSFDPNGHTMMGCTVDRLVETAEKYGADAVGMNCSSSPADMFNAGKRFAELTKLPIIIKLNAGKPDMNGKYSVSPTEYAEQLIKYTELGVKIVGGCCGTTTDYIRAVKAAFETK